MAEILLVAAVVVVLAVAFFVLSRRSGAASEDAAPNAEMEEGVVSEPVPVAASTPRAAVVKDDVDVAQMTAPAPARGWTTQFEPRSGALDEAARLKLINDLGMLRAPWCIPLLERACEEETDPAIRSAARSALARCGDTAPSQL